MHTLWLGITNKSRDVIAHEYSIQKERLQIYKYIYIRIADALFPVVVGFFFFFCGKFDRKFHKASG